MQLVCNKTDLTKDAPLKPSILSATKSILLQCVNTLLFLPLSFAFLPIYVIGVIIWGHPFTNRILIFIIIFDFLVKGVLWFLDEILYPSYHQCEIKDPLFFISGACSGSTLMADYS